jgi:hypothetical protein
MPKYYIRLLSFERADMMMLEACEEALYSGIAVTWLSRKE